MEKKQPPKKPAIKVKSNVMMVAPRNMDQETQRELLLTEKKAAQLQEELNNLQEQIKKMRQEALNPIVNTPANFSSKQPKPEKPGEEKNKQKRNRNPGPKKKKPQAQTAPPGKGKQKERETITFRETTTPESTAPENTTRPSLG